MPSWKKILQSGSAVHVLNITASGLSNSTQPNIIGYDTASGRFTYFPTSSIAGGTPGTGTENYITRWSSGTTITTSSIYESGSRIGIGTTNPSNTLQVSGSLWTTTITASSLPNLSQPNIIGYDTASGRFTYMPTSSFSATLTQNLTANQTVGGVSSGTTFNNGQTLENVLRAMLITFISASISSLSLRDGGSSVSLSNRDVNSSFVINTASFSAVADNPDNRFPISASITSSNASSDFQHYLSNTLTATNAFGLGSSRTINRTTNGTVTFTVRALRPDNFSTLSIQASVSFLYKNYLAASSTDVTNNTTAQTVINSNVASQLASTKNWTATCTSANSNVNNFTYIIYPTSYGDLSNVIQNGALSVLTAFTKIGDFTITTPTYGASVSMRFYKSNLPGAFASNTTLAIS